MSLSAGVFGSESPKLSVGAFTGAIGDSVTVLPVVVAIAALTELSLSHLLLGFAVFQVVWGVRYGLPVSVEPMKALAALVIAGSLTTDELVVAGLLAGVILFTAGSTRTLRRVSHYVGEPVVRGVQLAVALLLLETGIRLSLGSPAFATLAVGVAAIVSVAGYRRASALVVLAVGFGVVIPQTGLPTPHVPNVAFVLPSLSALSSSALEGTAAQLAMTVGNAAVATSLLLSDYYDADVSPDELATSMGVMNLLAVPLGAVPMCHGSGGVAGKYAFGARTAWSNIVLGTLYALAAVFAVGIVAAFPLSMLGVVLALVAVELGRAGFDTEARWFAVGVGLLGVVANVGVAFVVGVVCYILWNRRSDATTPV
ncbi:sulfate transporter [Halogeometricum borinquense]|uniref:Sulfate transporter n=1 Tax=Halogeometricum borinquense TaxID=60847 RepID=A0A482TAU5_9EURY|nr:putative sulfate/molybdate transporter [Halogeometricum borinquense]RYJ14750.1 sulfate transporter [Halogeometricum borinquense]